MKAISAGGFAIGKRWEKNRSKLRQIFTLLTGYEFMFEESRKDIKSVNPIPKVDTPVWLHNDSGNKANEKD